MRLLRIVLAALNIGLCRSKVGSLSDGNQILERPQPFLSLNLGSILACTNFFARLEWRK